MIMDPSHEKLPEGLKVLAEQEKDVREDRFYRLNVFEKDGQLIVQFSLMDISRAVFKNGYLLGTVSILEKGYGKEAGAATLDVAFNTLKLHRVEAGIEPHNKRSIALAKSLKMRREGLSKRRLYYQKQWVDMVIYALTVEEFTVEA